jgi:hypothetical protein
MADDSLITTERKPIGWYEEVIPLRGCHLSLDNIKEVYRDLQAINQRFGEQIISTIPRSAEMTDAEWDIHKAFLLKDAFCLTTRVNGLRDEQLYGETVEIFDSPNLPKPIKSIYFTNANSFKRHADGIEPKNGSVAQIG